MAVLEEVAVGLTAGQRYKLGLRIGEVIVGLFAVLAGWDDVSVEQAVDEWYIHQLAVRDRRAVT